MSQQLRLDTANPDLPQVFGRYLLLSRLSRGGMGEIFLAKHGMQGFEKLVVIKKVLPHLVEDGEFIKRFIDEAQVAIKLQHQNIAQVFEVGCIGQEYFLSLEYIEGRDVRRIARTLADRGERLPAEHSLFIAREIASGLAYAHRRTDASGASLNLVHCDISPPNIVVSFEGETKIIDFGIAKSAMRRTATDPKLGFGKFGYMAPEQLVRGGVVDQRTDIYAAGVVLFELLTGTRMFEPGETPDYRALARMVARGEHPLPSHIDPTLRPFDPLVARALRPDPNERYAKAAEFRDALQTALVAIRPAMNHDHLGSFVRYMFSDEVALDRAAMARALATDLQPYQEEMSSQSAGTVTFALANLPLRPRQETELVDRATRPHRRVGRGMALTGAIALVALLVGGAAVAWMTGGGGADAPAGPALASIEPLVMEQPESDSAGAPTPTVATIDMPDAAPPAVAVLPPAPAPEPAAAPPRRGRKKPRPKPRPRSEPSRSDAADARTADPRAINRKFSAVSREYEKFRARHGGVLQAEWADLLTFAQYAKSNPAKLEALDTRIDTFRARMRKR